MSGRHQTIVIAGGGTGGHIFPGLAAARALRSLRPDVDVAWLGGQRGQEARLVPKHDLPFHAVRAARITGGSPWERARGFAALSLGVAQALTYLVRRRPAAVLGVGGYASAAGGAAARLLAVPLVLQEQNALPGRTNRVLGRFASRIAISFEAARSYFPKDRCVLTGNPVREDIAQAPARDVATTDERSVLVLGGSQGARFLNENVPSLLAALAQEGRTVTVRHQTGPAELADTRARYAQAGLPAEVVPFIDDMAAAYAAADLVICRAGASTVAELAVAGRPALLVPFPFAADDHQAANARALVDAGAASMVRQEQWQTEMLAPQLARMLGAVSLRAMSAHARAVGRPGAARAVASLVLAAAGLAVTGPSGVPDGRAA